MSSPRRKMVVVASPQPNELEQKKRRQTLERAKASHLSKQLQMRLQYAKLKVEHGWQRQNLNEVENLYFHHSHLRNVRQRHQYVTLTHPPAPVPPDTHVVRSLAPSGVPDRTAGPSPAANEAASDHVSPPSQSPLEHVDGPQSSSLYPSSTPTHSSSTSPAFDLSDPNILARLVQLQVPLPLLSQPQSQTLSRQSSTTIPSSTSTSTNASQSALVPPPITPSLGVVLPHIPLTQTATIHPQPGFALAAYTSQVPIATLAPGTAPLYSILASTPHNSTISCQPSIPAVVPTSTSAPPALPTTPLPTPTPIAATALTYDSFWSTHASSTGPTRALYRTHTGFTASATPAGNVAMLTPGGHAAVMTAEGVYVGGGSGKTGS